MPIKYDEKFFRCFLLKIVEETFDEQKLLAFPYETPRALLCENEFGLEPVENSQLKLFEKEGAKKFVGRSFYTSEVLESARKDSEEQFRMSGNPLDRQVVLYTRKIERLAREDKVMFESCCCRFRGRIDAAIAADIRSHCSLSDSLGEAAVKVNSFVREVSNDFSWLDFKKDMSSSKYLSFGAGVEIEGFELVLCLVIKNVSKEKFDGNIEALVCFVRKGSRGILSKNPAEIIMAGLDYFFPLRRVPMAGVFQQYRSLAEMELNVRVLFVLFRAVSDVARSETGNKE